MVNPKKISKSVKSVVKNFGLVTSTADFKFMALYFGSLIKKDVKHGRSTTDFSVNGDAFYLKFPRLNP